MIEENLKVQSAGHESNIESWAESEAGQEFEAQADQREQAEAEQVEDRQEQAEEGTKVASDFAELDADEPDEPDEPEQGEQPEQPSRSASKEAWQDYARDQGADDTDIDGLSRDDLADAYGDR